MKTLRTIREVRQELAGAGHVGLVPTMGGLHEGHLALYLREPGQEECDTVVVPLVNRPVRCDGRAFRRYPRDESRDAQLAEAADVDILFTPSVEEMYPDGYATWIDADKEIGAEARKARLDHFRCRHRLLEALQHCAAVQVAITSPERRPAGQRSPGRLVWVT